MYSEFECGCLTMVITPNRLMSIRLGTCCWCATRPRSAIRTQGVVQATAICSIPEDSCWSIDGPGAEFAQAPFSAVLTHPPWNVLLDGRHARPKFFRLYITRVQYGSTDSSFAPRFLATVLEASMDAATCSSAERARPPPARTPT